MKLKKIMVVIFAVMFAISLVSVNAFASSEAKASVPVKLTVYNEYKSVSVTVPASFPVEIYNGTVITADSAKITNNSNGKIKVSAVNVKEGSFKIGDYNNFNGNNTIALKLNGIPTTGSGSLKITEKAFPIIASKGTLSLQYYAKVSGNVSSMANKEIATIVFTISTVD